MASTPPTFVSLPYLDAIRASAANANSTITARQVGRVQVLSNISDPSDALQQDEKETDIEEEVALCHIPLLGLFSLPAGLVGNPVRIPYNRFDTQQELLTVLLALEHLNTGNGTIIPQVQGLNERCNIRFTTQALDTYFSPNVAVNHAISLMTQQQQNTNNINNSPLSPCLFLGALSSSSSIALSIMASTQQIPVWSPLSTSNALDSKEQHPLFGRYILSGADLMVCVVRFFREVLNVKHLAVLHMNNDYGMSDARAISDAMRAYDTEMLKHLRVVDVEADRASIDYKPSLFKAISFLKETQYRYFFVASDDPLGVLSEAFDQGIAGTGEHHFLFPGIAGDIADGLSSYPKGSKQHLMLRGVMQASAVGNYLGKVGEEETNSKYVQLVETIRQLQHNPADRDYISKALPTYPDAPSLFDVNNPLMYEIAQLEATVVPAFAYDTVISAGLTACELANKNNSNNGGTYFDGPTHYQAMLLNSFEGVTGRTMLNPNTGSRTLNTTQAIFRNIQDTESNVTHVTPNEAITFLFQNDNYYATGTPHIFNDGTTNMPPDLFPALVDYHYIGSTLRSICLALVAMVLLLSFAFNGWTVMHWPQRVVRASQPVFLLLICIGTLLMGVSIIPLTFDDQITESMDAACMAVPWLLCLGFGITFSALFAKTFRVNRLFSSNFRKRVQLTARDVMAPIVIVATGNILVLGLWTGLHPLRWTREIVAVNQLEQGIESRGTCWTNLNDDSGGVPSFLPYTITLVVWNLGIMVLAVHQSYLARHIHLE